MRRPLWILALLLALAVAAVFAWLGQWQMGHAIRIDAEQAIDTETPHALSDLTTPAEGVKEDAAGVVALVDGAFVPGDSRLVEQRMNGGENGVWVVGRLATGDELADAGAQLAVAIGWAPDRAAAEEALRRLEADPAFAEPLRLEGRYMPAEGPEIPGPGEDPHLMRTMMPAYLANTWSDVDGPTYAGFLVLHASGGAGEGLLASAGLDAIDSVPPLPPEKVNWLNVFYAIEWVVFAGFAIFFWYRLARDAWEKEHELKLLADGRDAVAP
ncbi:hypothetical protein JD276_11890 [Leucobacter sp. CSA1]|uniref:SURF1-like protein n=1 Tax=Leucobacter chromiisoli TaxID=2796471 RepID=A0A934UVQ6_9MICO|nr:SURF1 family cytochrome oxidase biogenesis protein [Leucobacter chromiisoli]MBK0419736.1 hypothetical protein [Leucobacter chromiisoli]